MATKKKVITSTQKKLKIVKKASKTMEEPKEKIKGNSKLKIKKAGEIKKKEEPKKKGVASSLKTREELRKEKAKEKKNKDGIIKPAFVEDLMKQYYLDYAMSVITDRSIPDIRDGLKPVQRRILYAMKNTTSYMKSARTVGDVLGRLHVHGDTSVYSAMVRMAQDWKMYIPLVDGHGNFGSLDDDPAAAMRYTEAKIDNNALEIFFKYNILGSEYKKNYDEREFEPIYLPSILPMFLINGTIGAAVGFSTNIPTHNPKEVINTYEAFIQGKLTNKNLRKYLKGPDPIVPCKVIDKGGIDRGYETGKGSFHCMMNYHIEEGSYGRKAIVFTSVLPNTSKAGAIESLADACKNEKSPVFNMIADLSDESDMENIRIVVLLKKGIDVNTALEALITVGFCYSQYSITSVLLVDGRPMRLGIIEMLTYFHKHQRELSERHLTALKNKHKERLVILDGIAYVIKNYDIVSTIIRNAKNKQDAKEKLMKKYKSLNEVQVNAILDTKLISLVNKGDAILTEQKQIKAQIKEIDLKLKDIDGYILGILNELKGTFRAYSQRRSVIVSEMPETSK